MHYEAVAPLPCSRLAILAEVEDTPASLFNVLKCFTKYEINLTHIESRPRLQLNDGFDIFIDFQGARGEYRTEQLVKDLQRSCRHVLVLDEKEVPWFPRHITELALIVGRTLDAGEDLASDHPGFHDPEYRARRAFITSLAKSYDFGKEIPIIEYTQVEHDTWKQVYQKLRGLHSAFACSEYQKIMSTMETQCGYTEQRIPQVKDVSQFLHSRTGFRMHPVSGLLSSRDFLNGLAFRTFFCTQYIRHSSRPLYTPEPDCIHELIGY